MVAAKGDQELDPEYVAFIRTQLTTACGTPEDAPVADLIRVCEPARSAL
jgi:hypothetical protein